MDDPFDIAIRDLQHAVTVPPSEFRRAIGEVLRGEGIASAEISVAVVDNRAIHKINRQFLDHDFPTDVITFPLSETADPLEGEIVISGEYAFDESRRHGWSAERELLLYAVHGALHLAGYDDQDAASRAVMRRLERHYLERLGVEVGEAIVRPDAGPDPSSAASHSIEEATFMRDASRDDNRRSHATDHSAEEAT